MVMEVQTKPGSSAAGQNLPVVPRFSAAFPAFETAQRDLEADFPGGVVFKPWGIPTDPTC